MVFQYTYQIRKVSTNTQYIYSKFMVRRTKDDISQDIVVVAGLLMDKDGDDNTNTTETLEDTITAIE